MNVRQKNLPRELQSATCKITASGVSFQQSFPSLNTDDECRLATLFTRH